MNINIKRALTILILLLSVVLFSSATKSVYYTKTVVITRIYPHKLGYKVFYMSNDLQNREIYLPNSLFESGLEERSNIFTGNDESYPYMSIFWKGGEFSHVKLYLKPDYRDITWGSFLDPDSHDENFKNAELKFDF